jgi:hypothetical protein
VVAQTQRRLASARQSGATQEQRDVLEGELSMAAHTAQHAHVLLAQLPQWQQAPAGTELSSPLPVVSDEQLGRLVETIAADTDHDSALAAVHSLKRLTADRMAATERTRVVQAGGVEVLCAMMARGDVEGGVAAARTLAQLARSKTLHGVLADAGVLPRLQSLLHYGLSVRGPTGDAAAAAAAMAMVNLCSGDRGTRRLVMLHGGMRSVVQLLALPVAPSDEALGNTLALYRSAPWQPPVFHVGLVSRTRAHPSPRLSGQPTVGALQELDIHVGAGRASHHAGAGGGHGAVAGGTGAWWHGAGESTYMHASHRGGVGAQQSGSRLPSLSGARRAVRPHPSGRACAGGGERWVLLVCAGQEGTAEAPL